MVLKVQVTALSSYEEKEEQFREEVTLLSWRDSTWFLLIYCYKCKRLLQVSLLRKQFFHSISPGGLAGDRRGVVPASGFSFSVEQIWRIIKENKDLDLPAHKVYICVNIGGRIGWFFGRLNHFILFSSGHGCHCAL